VTKSHRLPFFKRGHGVASISTAVSTLYDTRTFQNTSPLGRAERPFAQQNAFLPQVSHDGLRCPETSTVWSVRGSGMRREFIKGRGRLAFNIALPSLAMFGQSDWRVDKGHQSAPRGTHFHDVLNEPLALFYRGLKCLRDCRFIGSGQAHAPFDR